MIEVILSLQLIYTLLLYKNGRKYVAGFSIIFVLLTASLYFVDFFLDEFSKYLLTEYGQEAYYNAVAYIEIITSVDSLPAAMYMLMLLSSIVSFIFTLQSTILVAVMRSRPYKVDDVEYLSYSSVQKDAPVNYGYSFRTETLAHLRI